jgi:hypothetical protein
MRAISASTFRRARARGTRARSVFDRHHYVGLQGPLLQVEVHRSPSGDPYVDTLRGPAEVSQRVFLTEGASTLFWGVRTYRLLWLDS